MKSQHTTIMHLRWDKVRKPLRFHELLDQMEDEYTSYENDGYSSHPQYGTLKRKPR